MATKLPDSARQLCPKLGPTRAGPSQTTPDNTKNDLLLASIDGIKDANLPDTSPLAHSPLFRILHYIHEPILTAEPADTTTLFRATSDIWPRFYWRNQTGTFEVLALGAAERIELSAATHTLGEAFSELESRLNEYSRRGISVAVGGSAFSSHPSKAYSASELEDPWCDFPWFLFVIPEVLIVNQQGSVRVESLEPDGKLSQEVRELLTTLTSSRDAKLTLANFTESLSPPLPSSLSQHSAYANNITTCSSPVSEVSWCSELTAILQAMSEVGIKKIVPARRIDITTTTAPSPIALLSWLTNGFSFGSPFFFAPTPSSTFLGCSPESLLRATANEISADAVAGTFWGNHTDNTTTQRRQLEHQIVVDYITNNFCRLGLNTTITPTKGLLSVGPFGHLSARISAPRPETLTIGELISSLHPTPAVCGVPNEEARRAMQRIEPFSRGWYAGMIGVFSPDYIELTVGIRSALIRGCTTHLFAGAGCVPGSNATEELEEINRKLALPLAFFSSS